MVGGTAQSVKKEYEHIGMREIQEMGWTVTGDYMTWVNIQYPNLRLVPAQIAMFYQDEKYRKRLLYCPDEIHALYPELP